MFSFIEDLTLFFFQMLPVLVFIDGGGFNTGSSSLGVYDPSILVTRGNIVSPPIVFSFETVVKQSVLNILGKQ